MTRQQRELCAHLLGFVLIIVIDILFISWISKTSNPDDFLGFQKYLAYLPVAITMIGLGGPFSILYYRARRLIKPVYAKSSIANSMVLGFGLALLASLVTWISHGIWALSLLTIVVAGTVGSVRQNLVSYHMGGGGYAKAAVLRVFFKFLSYLPLTFFLLVFSDKYGIVDVLICIIVGELFTLIVLKKFTNWLTLNRPNLSKRYWAHAIGSVFANLNSGVIVAIPYTIVGFAEFSALDAAMIASALTVIRYLPLALAPAFQLIVPRLGSLKNNPKLARRWVVSHGKMVILYAIFVAMPIAYFSDSIVLNLLSSEYIGSAPLLALGVVSLPFLLLNSFLATCLSALGRVSDVCKISYVYSVLILVIMGLATILDGRTESFMLAYCASHAAMSLIYSVRLVTELR